MNIDSIQSWLGTGSINIFGMPFAGKDTQGRVLAEQFNGVLLSGGEIMRTAKENEKVQEVMASGGLVSSELFEEIVMPHISDEALKERPLLLSEVGRMEGEQIAVTNVCERSGHPIKAAIHLHLPDEEVYARFDASRKTGDRGDRADDKREVLQKRIESYKNNVLPVLEWYRQKGLLIEVDGTQSYEAVTNSILEALNEQAAG